MEQNRKHATTIFLIWGDCLNALIQLDAQIAKYIVTLSRENTLIMWFTKNISTNFLGFIPNSLNFTQLKMNKIRITTNLQNQNNSNFQTQILISTSDDISTDGGILDLEII